MSLLVSTLSKCSPAITRPHAIAGLSGKGTSKSSDAVLSIVRRLQGGPNGGPLMPPQMDVGRNGNRSSRLASRRAVWSCRSTNGSRGSSSTSQLDGSYRPGRSTASSKCVPSAGYASGDVTFDESAEPTNVHEQFTGGKTRPFDRSLPISVVLHRSAVIPHPHRLRTAYVLKQAL